MCVLVGINQLGFGAMVPALPLYAQSFGVAASAIGLAVAAYGLARFVTAALDLTTLGRAHNTWPWRPFTRAWLGGNPIWTSDSVGVRGWDERPYWVSVGTNRRDELVALLERAVPAAKERVRAAGGTPFAAAVTPPGWHPDPWDPVGGLRWWDGRRPSATITSISSWG